MAAGHFVFRYICEHFPVENLSLELAYARYGAEVSSRYRNLSSVAADGSLVLSCPSERFSRPQAGVLRYSATISRELAPTPSVVALRTHIQTAHTAGTVIRPVLISQPRGENPRNTFVRPDLTGRVVTFDGDSFEVDFTRVEPDEPVKKGRRR